MTDRSEPPGAAWFAGLDIADPESAGEAIRDGESDEVHDWPRAAIDAGVVDSTDEYYDRLHAATMNASRQAVWRRERADDQQLIHGVRAMDDMARILV
jgi:nucleolar protein 56